MQNLFRSWQLIVSTFRNPNLAKRSGKVLWRFSDCKKAICHSTLVNGQRSWLACRRVVAAFLRDSVFCVFETTSFTINVCDNESWPVLVSKHSINSSHSRNWEERTAGLAAFKKDYTAVELQRLTMTKTKWLTRNLDWTNGFENWPYNHLTFNQIGIQIFCKEFQNYLHFT